MNNIIKLTPSEIFSDLLEEKKKKTQMTQAQIAGDMKINASVVSKYKSGIIDIASIEVSNLIKISEYFNVSTDYLLGKTIEPDINIEAQSIAKLTGLKKNTIDFFIEMQKDEPAGNKYPYWTMVDVLNFLCEDYNCNEKSPLAPNFLSFFEVIADYFTCPIPERPLIKELPEHLQMLCDKEHFDELIEPLLLMKITSTLKDYRKYILEKNQMEREIISAHEPLKKSKDRKGDRQ